MNRENNNGKANNTRKKQIQQQQNVHLLSKILYLLLWHPILILVLGILGFMGKGAAPLAIHLRRRWPAFPGLMSYPLQAEALN
jgi:hypothetical protein